MKELVVLVVDDEPGLVRFCQVILEKADFQVFATTSPVQALSYLDLQPVDVLLVDIKMPGVTGFDLVNQARRKQPDITVVFMTSFGTVEMAISALNQGVDGLILKGFKRQELIDHILWAHQENQQKREAARLMALRPLMDASRALFLEKDAAALQHNLVALVHQHLQCSAACLYRVTGDAPQLVASEGYDICFCAGLSDDERLVLMAITDYLGHHPTLWLKQDMIPLPEFRDLLAQFQLKGLLASLIVGRDEKYLLIALRGAKQPAFFEADQDMFVILSHQAAASLENIYLYDELKASIAQLEKSQRAAAQAERIATAGRLTATIAHEINNPLQALSTYLHLADSPTLTPLERQKRLKLAQNELNRLISIVQRMLDFYRPGKRDRKYTDINEVIQRVLMLLKPQFEDNGIIVNVDLSDSLPGLMVIASQLQQVFLNLIINAMEAMPGGGQIIITTRPLVETPGVEILVEDTGPGIPAAQREHLFEPFETSKESGTGLGLAVSYFIVNAHGGTLSYVERNQSGACFRITLPEDIER